MANGNIITWAHVLSEDEKKKIFKMSLVDQSDEDCHNLMMDCGFTSNRAVTTSLHWKYCSL